MPSRGFVYLVGAGPGDPRLLTLRAYELLRSAEVVAHDELVTDAILALAPPDAERLAVGRRRGHGTASHRLHPDVLERVRAGQTVVRLKCGDPLVFGRGGEEAEQLAEEGIPFEIVPGISAAIGAAAYAGIPLTHRGRSSAVTFATGHEADETRPRGGTVALYMASRRLEANLARLVSEGWPATTPAAYIVAATTPAQRVIVGTLGDLATRLGDVDRDAPALVIAGDVVALRERIAWFERQPLRGRRVLVARARAARSQIAAELRLLGAEVLEAPQVEIADASDDGAFASALACVEVYDAVVFGCAPGVVAARTCLAMDGLRIISVGRDATAALARSGVTPGLAIEGACREVLEEHAAELRGRRLLVVASAAGRSSLVGELARLGADVTVASAYRHVQRMPDGPLPPVDLVVLPSSSAARAVLANERGTALRRSPMVAIGPVTEAEARKLGATRVVRAATDTIPAVVTTVLATLEAP